PKFAPAHQKLARAYLKQRAWNSAHAELTRALELEPDNQSVRLDLGRLLLVAGHYTEALNRANEILSKEPNNVDAVLLRADAFSRLEEYDGAQRTLQEAIRLAPDRPQSYLLLAHDQAAVGQKKEAEEAHKKAITLLPNSVTPLLALGSFYQRERRWQEAEQQFRLAMQVEPSNPVPVAYLARLALAQGDKARAEQTLIESKQNFASQPEGYRMLAEFYALTRDFAKALAEYGVLLSQHPDDLTVKKNYVQMLIHHQRLDEAWQLNEQILAKNSKDVEGLVAKGHILNQRGRPTEAIGVIEAALKNEPGSAFAHYYLGEAFRQTGDWGRAEAEW
ncbi:MAG: tetratricopeptide repeat protein, partial [Terriglobales bacterium]